jgi:hypothetical protein
VLTRFGSETSRVAAAVERGRYEIVRAVTSRAGVAVVSIAGPERVRDEVRVVALADTAWITTERIGDEILIVLPASAWHVHAVSVAPSSERCRNEVARPLARVPFVLTQRVGVDEIGIVFVSSASAESAAAKWPGKMRPRRSARRRIPVAALGLKKYFRGTVEESSSTADKEHSTPSLGDSEISAVQNPVAPSKPALGQCRKDGVEVASSVASKEPWNILKDESLHVELAGNPQKLVEQTRACAAQPFALPGYAHVLAREAADQPVNRRQVRRSDRADIIKLRHIRPVLREHLQAERFALDLKQATQTGLLKPKPEAFNTGKEASECHSGIQ